MTNTNDEARMNDETRMTNEAWNQGLFPAATCAPFEQVIIPVSSFVIRHSFVIPSFVIRHSSTV